MYIWNTASLVKSVAAGELTTEEKFKYLLFGNVMYAASGYLAWLFVTASSGWLFWYEAFMVVIVTYFGTIRCRDNYVGVHPVQLLEAVIILGVPLMLKLLLVSWALHYGVPWILHWTIGGIYTSSQSTAKVIGLILDGARTFVPLLITVLGTMWFFWRLSFHLRTVASSSSPT